jgi:CO/xanthine dehydrogenase Mo-binding subunit
MKFRKDFFADERDDNLNEVGKPTRRQDIEGHVTGRSPFADDRNPAALLHIKCARSTHPHARLTRIDTSEAERMPGVKRIIRNADIPKKVHTILTIFGFGLDDEPVLALDKVRYVGEPIVAVVADSERAAYEAVAKVRVEYAPLPAVFDPEDALKPGAPLVNEYHGQNYFKYWDKYDHQKIRFGDVEAGFRQSDLIVEGRYQMSPIEHAPTETNACVAIPAQDGRIAVYTSTQGLFFSLDNTADILQIPPNKLHFIGGTVGGGFGGKVDTVVEPLAVLAAMMTGRAVRYVYGREEEMQVSSPRGAERVYIKDGVMRDGRIIAREVHHYNDGGAYVRLTNYGTIKAAAHYPGPYTIPNVSVNCYCVFTNRTPSSAMRGFGVTGADFALESHMDKIARTIGMDPMEFRIVNAYRDGDMKAHRKVTEGAALIECIQAAAELAGWPLREDSQRLSSRVGGGGQRAAVPTTPESGAPSRGAGPRYQPEPAMSSASAAPSRPAMPASPVAPTPSSAPSPTTQGGTSHGAARFSSVFGTRRR